MLTDRRQQVLAALIEEYVSHALPVGSRTLVEHYNLGVSPATVRNELSVLEEGGYISQPHTSAGRIPTDFGYRSFVDDLLESESSAEGEADEAQAEQVARLRESATELDALIDQTNAALSRLTECLSVVLPPSALSLHIRQVTLVLMSVRRVVMVLVGEDGTVYDRTVELDHDVDVQDVTEAQATMNRLFAGKSFTDIRQALDDEAAAMLRSPLLQRLIGEVFACLKGSDRKRTHSTGLSTLMRQPEFSHSQFLVPILQVLEDDTVLLELLQGTEDAKGTVVRIGHENSNEQLAGVSIVAAQFGRAEGEGVVAVIGPTRMNYAQAIRAVRLAQRTLQDE